MGEKDVEFTPEDEETLVNTTPVGVLVFDAKTGGLMSVNREARRIVSGLHMPDGSAEQLLDMYHPTTSATSTSYTGNTGTDSERNVPCGH